VSCPSALVYGDAYRHAPYDFGASHPLQPARMEMAVALMAACGLLDAPNVSRIEPRPATTVELQAVHDAAYVAAVRELSIGDHLLRDLGDLAAGYGFHHEDNPVFPGMAEAAALVAGSTVAGAEAILDGSVLHAFVPAGGMHHAHRARASGFCIFNDPAVAIAAVRARYGIRVAYVDVDAHHADGMQSTFYNDPNVLTISLHESGLYLFPGEGFIHEQGEGAGFGYNVNMPLQRYTTDAPYLLAFHAVVPPLLRAFKPDLLVTQCGCDSHWLDPLSHLATSTAIWPVLANTFHDLAHELCGGRWLAMGGGGFDPYSVVPRAWTMLFAGMCGMDLPAELPRSFLELRQQHVASLPGPLPGFATTFAETMDLPIPEAHYQYVLDITARTLGRLREAAFPPLGATDTD